MSEPNDPPIIFWYSTTTPHKKKQNIPLKELPFPNRTERIFFQAPPFWQGRAVKLRFFFSHFILSLSGCFGFTAEKQASGFVSRCFWLLLLSLDIIFLILNLLNPPGPTEEKKQQNRLTCCQKKPRIFG